MDIGFRDQLFVLDTRWSKVGDQLGGAQNLGSRNLARTVVDSLGPNQFLLGNRIRASTLRTLRLFSSLCGMCTYRLGKDTVLAMLFLLGSSNRQSMEWSTTQFVHCSGKPNQLRKSSKVSRLSAIGIHLVRKKSEPASQKLGTCNRLGIACTALLC